MLLTTDALVTGILSIFLFLAPVRRARAHHA